MKPRIIILMHYMELGGAEMALLGLLNAIDYAKTDVDLFIYSHQGPLMKHIPSQVNLLAENKDYSQIEKPIKSLIKSGNWNIAVRRLLAKLHNKVYQRTHPTTLEDASCFQYVADYVSPTLPAINPTISYDLCISFLTPHNYGLYKVNAKKRLAWIHTDYSKIRINQQKEYPIWSKYDYIASISPDVRSAFISTFPALSKQIIEIENILPLDYIKNRADESLEDNDFIEFRNNQHYKILSIGRYTNAKNFDNVANICKILRRNLSKRKNCDVKWYLIGYGPDEKYIREQIRKEGMNEHVILLGKKENPYPFIKHCDLYVQPSRYEGKSVTVREAQILQKSVVITNYPTASSQIIDGIDGKIVPLENIQCAEGIAKFIQDSNLQKNIQQYLQTHDYANMIEIKKIYNLL